MGIAHEFSIILPLDMVEAAEKKVQSGDYASASEVVGEGMRALMEPDAAVERWLREYVVAGHQEYLADPSKRISADAILGRIKGWRAAGNISREFVDIESWRRPGLVYVYAIL